MSVDPAVELHDEGAISGQTLAIAWLRPLLPDGQVANGRLPNSSLPFVVVSFLEGNENLDESYVDDLVSVHCLYAKGIGNANMVAAERFTDAVHRRMLLWGRTLEPVTISGQLWAPEYVDVAKRPSWEEYADDQIIRKLSRYRIGQGYAKLS